MARRLAPSTRMGPVSPQAGSPGMGSWPSAQALCAWRSLGLSPLQLDGLLGLAKGGPDLSPASPGRETRRDSGVMMVLSLHRVMRSRYRQYPKGDFPFSPKIVWYWSRSGRTASVWPVSSRKASEDAPYIDHLRRQADFAAPRPTGRGSG